MLRVSRRDHGTRRGKGEVIFSDDVESTPMAYGKNRREKSPVERWEKSLNFNGFIRWEKVGDLLGNLL